MAPTAQAARPPASGGPADCSERVEIDGDNKVRVGRRPPTPAYGPSIRLLNMTLVISEATRVLDVPFESVKRAVRGGLILRARQRGRLVGDAVHHAHECQRTSSPP